MTDATARAARRSTPRRAAGPERLRDDVLDELDRRIIRHLQVNARMPNTEIARALQVTETTIRNRVSRLIDEELIEIVAVVTPKAQQVTLSAFMALTVEQARVEEVITVLSGRPEIRFLSRMLAPAQVLAEAFFADSEHLLQFQVEFLSALPGLVSVDSSLVLRVEKASFEWEI